MKKSISSKEDNTKKGNANSIGNSISLQKLFSFLNQKKKEKNKPEEKKIVLENIHEKYAIQLISEWFGPENMKQEDMVECQKGITKDNRKEAILILMQHFREYEKNINEDITVFGNRLQNFISPEYACKYIQNSNELFSELMEEQYEIVLKEKKEIKKPKSFNDLKSEILFNKDKSVKQEDRHLIHVTMGQGVTADLTKFILYSNQFSSCSPVILYNSKTKMGGMFHYGAGAKSQLVHLGNMVNKINPTWVRIEDRSEILNINFYRNSEFNDEPDHNILYSFFEEKYNIKPEVVKNGSNAYSLFLNNPEDKTPSLSPSKQNANRVNLTKQSKLPEELSELGIDFFYDEGVYDALFAEE